LPLPFGSDEGVDFAKRGSESKSLVFLREVDGLLEMVEDLK